MGVRRAGGLFEEGRTHSTPFLERSFDGSGLSAASENSWLQLKQIDSRIRRNKTDSGGWAFDMLVDLSRKVGRTPHHFLNAHSTDPAFSAVSENQCVDARIKCPRTIRNRDRSNTRHSAAEGRRSALDTWCS